MYISKPTRIQTSLKDAVCDLALPKVVDIWAQQPMKWLPSLPCTRSNVLIGWDCLWLGPSHSVSCFTEPGQGPEFFWTQTTDRWRTVRSNVKNLSKIYGIRIAECRWFYKPYTKERLGLDWDRPWDSFFSQNGQDTTFPCSCLLLLHVSKRVIDTTVG